MLSKQQTHVAQCAFFLIDDTPECPQDMEPRAFTDDAITQHLARHTYTYRAHGKPGRKHAKEVTIQWMRKWFTRLCEKPMTKDFQRKPGEHAADALFRLGSGVIPDHIKAKFQYDPDNFSESDLPGLGDKPSPGSQSSRKDGSGTEASKMREPFGQANHHTSQQRTLRSVSAAPTVLEEENSDSGVRSRGALPSQPTSL
jgi:hypothetical protein